MSRSTKAKTNAPWVALVQGDPFAVLDDEEGDFGWEIAIVREGHRGQGSWGWFGPNKLAVSVGKSGYEGAMTKELWKELKSIAVSTAARMNEAEKRASSRVLTFKQEMLHPVSDGLPHIEVVRASENLSASCNGCGYLNPSALRRFKCRTGGCPVAQLEGAGPNALDEFRRAVFKA